ncbi:MAG: hypothetical protein Q8M16_01015 [Pirellulaceae bacterium]|nr:hypothetical protein [Pirellulaceae bacterium]
MWLALCTLPVIWFLWFAFRHVQFDSIMRTVPEKVVVLKEAKQLFESEGLYSSVSYFDGRLGKPSWNSRVLVCDRYELSVFFVFNYSGFEITHLEPPTITLAELESIDVVQNAASSEPNISIRYKQNFRVEITLEEWKTLVESEGDFSKIGVDLNCDLPVENIQYLPWKKWHRSN